MSDFESALDDELLALAGVDKKRKKKQGPTKPSASKKRKADMSDSEEEGPESEEAEANPYPLEGKYIDEADRLRLMQMSEIEREETIALRLEEKQRLHDKRMLSRMVKEQRGGEADSVAKAAKRQHTARGATKEKSRKLDELKAKRKAKDVKQRTKGSPKRDRSSSPMDMEISDDESEDGQITKLEEEEERERKLLTKPTPDDDLPATITDLEKCRLTRDSLAKYCLTPWFQDYVQDAWVRYLIGQENGESIYRICEVKSLGPDLVKPYKFSEKTTNQVLELKHGKHVKTFMMDKVSNAPFTQKEFDRFTKTMAHDGVKLPNKRSLEKKSAELIKLATQPLTEEHISAMLARKNQLNSHKPSGMTTLEKSRLTQARTLAERRHDFAEVAEIDAKLAELAASTTERRPSNRDEVADMLAKVNERNRKANMEAVRKAELAESERKRRERKLAASNNTGTSTPLDPSARLKIKPRLFDAATPTTRPGTPTLVASTSTPASAKDPSSRPVSPLPPSSSVPALTLNGSTPKKTTETSIFDSIEIDLGDF